MVKDMAKQISGGAAGGGAAVHFKSLEDVDSKIKEMEAEMMTTSLSITEEKKKLQAIQQLQSGKKAIAALTEQRARVSQLKEANEMSREDLRTWQQELRSKTATLNDLREQEKEIDQKIATLRESAPSMQVT
jgi:DNA repair ATPase RecN